MDKETLSNYGWIVILVLILAVLLALATPFGNFVAGAIKATTAGFFGVNESALGAAGITIPGQEFEDVDDGYNHDAPALHPIGTIPEGGTYYVGVSAGTQTGDYSTATAIYSAGQEFPDTVNLGDVYVYGDYEYRYKQFYDARYSQWLKRAWDLEGWGVRVLDTAKTTYGPILESINGEPLTNMDATFYDCQLLENTTAIPSSVKIMEYTFGECWALTDLSDLALPIGLTDMAYTFNNCMNIVTAPAIPNSVTDMFNTFHRCKSLTAAPVLPDSLKDMGCTFQDCETITNAPVIPNGVGRMTSAFSGCKSLTTAPILPDSVTSVDSIFQDCSSLKTYHGSTDPDGDFSNYVIPSKATSLHLSFSNCVLLVSAPDLSNCTNLTTIDQAFMKCKALVNAPDLSNCIKLTNMTETFFECTSLTDLSNFVIPANVTDMTKTFYCCSNLTAAPAIPSKVTNMEKTFSACYDLVIAPDMSNATGVKQLKETFYYCSELVSAPDLSNCTKIVDISKAFYYCSKLTGTIEINATNINVLTDCFKNTAQSITLTGTSTRLASLAATANKGNVTVQQ